MTAYQNYDFSIQFLQIINGAHLLLAWTDGVFANTYIPSSGFGYFSDVAQSPYQFTVVCPRGFAQEPGSFTICKEIWGDNLVVGIEICDDGNLVSGDGWQATWDLIEHPYICNIDPVTEGSVCEECQPGYTPNATKDKCVRDAISDSIYITCGLIAGLVLMAMVLNILNSATNKSSLQSMFSGINQLQLIQLLPLIGAYMTYDPLLTIVGTSVTLFNFSYMSLEAKLQQEGILTSMSFTQYNSYLFLINLEDGSTMVSITNLIGVSVLIPILHIFIELIKWWLKPRIKGAKTNRWRRLIFNAHKWLTFGWYIRYIMEIYLMLLLSSLFEIYVNIKGWASSSDSFVAAIIIAILWILIIFISMFYSCCLHSRRQSNSWKTVYVASACFSGVKRKDWYTRMSIFVFFLRRALLTIIVILFVEYSLMVKLTVYTSIQVAMLWYVIIVRPFEEIKDQITEIVNEIIYLFLVCFLFVFNKKGDWDKFSEQIFIWTIIGNNILLIVIALFALVISVIQKFRKTKVTAKVK